MTKFFGKVTFMSGLACGLFLISCQDQDAATMIQPSATKAEIALAPPLMTPGFKLSKFGNESLTYHSDGRLKQVSGTADPATTGYSAYRIEYEYSGNSVVATRFGDNNKNLKMEWRLENGRAVELTKTKHDSEDGTVLATMHATYQYNNQDQLIKLITIGEGKKIYTFTYDNLGNVTKILLQNSTKNGDEFENLMKYEYTEYVGGPIEADKGSIINQHIFGPYTLNGLGDRYLPIFGKFGKHLLKKSIKTNFPLTIKYAYKINSNGYVQKQELFTKNGKFIESQDLVYVIPIKNRL